MVRTLKKLENRRIQSSVVYRRVILTDTNPIGDMQQELLTLWADTEIDRYLLCNSIFKYVACLLPHMPHLSLRAFRTSPTFVRLMLVLYLQTHLGQILRNSCSDVKGF